MQPSDWEPLWLTLRLATLTTLVLLCLAPPVAWWLARSRHWLRQPVAAVVALPLVLPPTVLGFYLLLLMGPDGWIGQLTRAAGIGLLPFTFEGLVVASVIYSLPFAVQPLHNAFATVREGYLETAATLRAPPWQQFLFVAVPLARHGFLTAAVLTFAHTIGEFGVILMIGGNIPGETRVLSVAIYDHVESLQYAQAHWLSGTLLAFSFLVLVTLYAVNSRSRTGVLR